MKRRNFEVEELNWHIISQLCSTVAFVKYFSRVKDVDLVPYLTTRLVDDFASHIKLYRRAQQKVREHRKDGKIFAFIFKSNSFKTGIPALSVLFLVIGVYLKIYLKADFQFKLWIPLIIM